MRALKQEFTYKKKNNKKKITQSLIRNGEEMDFNFTDISKLDKTQDINMSTQMKFRIAD